MLGFPRDISRRRPFLWYSLYSPRSFFSRASSCGTVSSPNAPIAPPPFTQICFFHFSISASCLQVIFLHLAGFGGLSQCPWYFQGLFVFSVTEKLQIKTSPRQARGCWARLMERPGGGFTLPSCAKRFGRRRYPPKDPGALPSCPPAPAPGWRCRWRGCRRLRRR